MSFGSAFSSAFSSAFGSEMSFMLEFDHDHDGNFDEASENITAYVVSGSIFVGKDDGSNLKGENIAASLVLNLLNVDGAWSKFNSSSPFYGELKPGRRVRASANAPTSAVMFTGLLDHVDPHVANKGLPRATLYAYGIFAKMTDENAKVNPPALANTTTGAVIAQVLDTLGFPSADRDIDDGVVPVGRWYPSEGEALALMREMKEQEGGELSEGKNWDVVFRDRYDRLLNHATSVATFTDDGVGPLGYRDIEQTDPQKNVFNRFEATLTPHTVQAEAQLWALPETVVLAPGESRTYFAEMPTSTSSGLAPAYVEAWTEITIGRDSTASDSFALNPAGSTVEVLSDVQVTAFPFAKSLKITIENIDASSHTITSLTADGTLVTTSNAYKIEAEDAASQADFGVRRYPVTPRWYSNSAYAQSGVDYELARNKDEHPVITKTIVGWDAAHFAQCVTRNFSDRITLEAESTQTQLGIDQDFYIEAIAHSFGAKQLLQTTFTLSPVIDVYGGADLFIIDTSELDGAHVLAY